MIIDVVIPSLSEGQMIQVSKMCLDSLRCSEIEHTFRVILVESGRELVDIGQDITIAYDLITFNYNHALNLGLSVCQNDWVVFANNDLIFCKNWMSEIIKAHERFPDVRSFSPWNSQHNWHETIYGQERSGSLIFGYRTCYELAGWCIVAKRDIFSSGVELSERVDFWYSDNVYADSLIKNRIPHALVVDSKVNHLTSQTKRVSEMEAEESYHKYVRGL